MEICTNKYLLINYFSPHTLSSILAMTPPFSQFGLKPKTKVSLIAPPFIPSNPIVVLMMLPLNLSPDSLHLHCTILVHHVSCLGYCKSLLIGPAVSNLPLPLIIWLLARSQNVLFKM